ncbi:BMPLb [Oopsacas minuta]|uniref:BMPLb n=1 Tax=Oopsacas minuta TaxID=111878 RepID=A0AAV7JT76_9METZ|nr:BMPLb [Oopsacas minuta]
MSYNTIKKFFQIYSPWKHRVFENIQIRLVLYLLLLYILSPPHWIYCRSTGEVTSTPEPNITHTINTTEKPTHGLSRFILDMYEALNRNSRHPIDPENIFYSRFVGPEEMKLVHLADNVRSLYPQKPNNVEDIAQLENQLSFHFDIKSIPSRERVHFGELRIWKSAAKDPEFLSLLTNRDISGQCLTLVLSATLLRGNNLGRERTFFVGRLRLKPNDLITPEYLSFHSSKLTSLLSRWQTSQTLELKLEVSSHCHNQATLTQLGIIEIEATPLLLVYNVIEGNDGYNDIPQDVAREIVRRSVESSSNRNSDPTETPPWLQGTSSSASTSCQRYSNQINFDAIGWGDWVIFPPSFDAYYCHGNCHYPIPSHYNSTNHALIQSLIHIDNPHRAPPVCCSPTEYDDLFIVYNEDDDSSTLEIKRYKNMIALSCGCR